MKNTFKKIIIYIITWQARLILKRHKPKIIAITGSVGKTSTKDAVFVVLSKFKTVRKSDKSFNSEIGLPLTIIGIPNGWDSVVVWIENILKGFYVLLFQKSYPKWLVLEVGAGKPNDIKSISKWLKPDVVVVTRFPDRPVHVEFFGSAENIIEEKSSLVDALKPNGLLILNHDDQKVYDLHQRSHCRTVSYGMHENATYRAVHPSYIYTTKDGIDVPSGINFKLEYCGNTFPVNLSHVVGMHYVGQALASIACANEIGCDLLESIRFADDYVTPPGRLSLIEGINNSVIIDDTYNASPVAMEAALDVLYDIKAKRKIAVLGDMLELGKFTEEAHRAIGKKVSEIADQIVIVGPRAKFISKGATENNFNSKNINEFHSATEASEFLLKFVKKGDIVLIKGSQGVRLERTVEAIMVDKENAHRLLCRQEKEWKKR